MDNSDRTTGQAYDDMKVHAPVLWTIMKYLPGRDLVNTRTLDSFWEYLVPDRLQEMERRGKSLLKPIDLAYPPNLEYFLASFNDGLPPIGIPLLQFANIQLNAFGTPLQTLRRFIETHGPFLRFLTVTIPDQRQLQLLQQFPLQYNLDWLKLLQQHCPLLEKISFMADFALGTVFPENILNDLDDVGTFPNLVGIESTSDWNPTFNRVLHKISSMAPKIHWIALTMTTNFRETFQQPMADLVLATYLQPLQHLSLVKLDLTTRSHTVFKQLSEMDLKVQELKISLLRMTENPSQEDLIAFGDWLGRRVTLQSLSILDLYARTERTYRARFPATSNIRKLAANGDFEPRIVSAQVPELEEAILTHCSPALNPFALGSVFPNMKRLAVDLERCSAQVPWEFAFPNLEVLELTVTLKAVGILWGFLSQFPTITQLSLKFNSQCSEKYQREAWWDLMTGRTRPMMHRGTVMEEVLASAPRITEGVEGNPTPPLLELFPELKRLDLLNSPEILAFAIIKLTVMEKMPHLEGLCILLQDEVPVEARSFISILKQYHGTVKVSEQPRCISIPDFRELDIQANFHD